MAWGLKKPQPHNFHSYRRGERQTGLIVFFVKKDVVQQIAWGSKNSHSRTISIPIAEANGRQRSGKGQSLSKTMKKKNSYFSSKNCPKPNAYGFKKSIPIAEANGRQESGKGQSGMNQTEETDTTKHTTEWTQSTKTNFLQNLFKKNQE